MITALLALRRTKASWLRYYFILQIIYDLACLISIIWGKHYPFVFSILTFLILSVSAVYTFENYRLETFHNRFYASVECLTLPVFVVAMTTFALRSFLPSIPISIAICECAALLSLGVGLMVTTHGDRTAQILSALWILLAAWEFSFAYGLPLARATFLALNQFVPAVLVGCAFLLIYWEGRARVFR